MFKYCLLFLLLPFKSVAQEQDGRLLLYNAGFGGVTAGIGAVFNQPKGANWKKTFVRAFWQGSIGGALHYSSKKTLYLINDRQDITYGLPAMLLHAAGNSLIENAAYNRPFLQSWNLNYGPFRFDFSFKDHGNFRARLLPAAIYGIVAAAPYGKPDWKTSALTGTMIFKRADRFNPGTSNLEDAAGLNYGRAIVYTTFYSNNQYETIAHELVHYFQFNEFQVFNTWLTPLTNDKRLTGLRKVFKRYVYFDAPYSSLPYFIEGYQPLEHYYRNFFELEAERFATNTDVNP